jgi:hypothetical protein
MTSKRTHILISEAGDEAGDAENNLFQAKQAIPLEMSRIDIPTLLT